MVKMTRAYLSRLEDLLTEGGYVVRYERGNFKSGYCVLKDSRIILINNFLPLEGRITCVTELALHLPLETELLTDRSRKLLAQLKPGGPIPEIDFNATETQP